MQTQTQIKNPVLKVIKYYADLAKLYYNCEDNSSEDKVRLRCGNFAISINAGVTESIFISLNTNTSKYTIKLYHDASYIEYTDVDGNVEHYSCHGDHHCIRNTLKWVKRAFAVALDGCGLYPPLPQDMEIELLFSFTRNGKGFIHVLLNGHRFHIFSIDPWGNIVFYPRLSHFNKYSFILNTAKVLL